MSHLLFGLIFSEMLLIVIFVFKTPLRKLVILGIDRVKRGRGPIVVKTVCATVFVVMMSSVYNVMSIHNRWSQDGEINPTDQILFAKHLLDASLMGKYHSSRLSFFFCCFFTITDLNLDGYLNYIKKGMSGFVELKWN